MLVISVSKSLLSLFPCHAQWQACAVAGMRSGRHVQWQACAVAGMCSGRHVQWQACAVAGIFQINSLTSCTFSNLTYDIPGYFSLVCV